MSEFPGYTRIVLLEQTAGGYLYRATSESTRETVIIKLLKIGNADPTEIVRIKHEFDLIRKIDSDGIVKIRDIMSTGDQFALVLEDFGGISLRHWLQERPAPAKALDLSIRLAEILGALHGRNVIHRNIKPDTILYNPASDTLKLSDFGIAGELIGLSSDMNQPELVRRTLAYISPEQTGRMNCPVDYRTDLYSLGATLYELFTGRPPFVSAEPMQIIHAHIARKPVPPNRLISSIPEPIADIIMRLLAKAAEERYQSGQGVLNDLLHCREQLQETGRIAPFQIGSRDVSPGFNIPKIMVGRERELTTLFEAFEQIASGKSSFMLVTGQPGIGKSALVNEIQKPVAGKNGCFVMGKYDQLRQSVPYSAFIQAGQELARQLLAEPNDRIAAWKQKLMAALQPNGRIITDIMPEMELIIGPQLEVPELLPEESRNRFKMVLKNFVRLFADKDHPLVLFLDDLQWADPASLGLIVDMALDQDLRYLLLIGAYRDNEAAAHHPLMLTVESIRSVNGRVDRLELDTLDKPSVKRLLISFLRCKPEAVEMLADIVHEKTLGNPFFINQFMKRLYEDKHLRLDPAAGWQWDTSTIANMQVTDNVAAFMAEKLRNLPADPLALIKIAACIGNRFRLGTLASVCAGSIEEVLDPIDILKQEGLVAFRDGEYYFQHDRIQEAAYSLLSTHDRERLHYCIGRLKLETTTAEALFGQVFYIADQLNKAHGLLSTPDERKRLCELNLTAGRKAKDSSAYAAAIDYLQAGIDLLPQSSWQSDYRLTYELYTEQMECRYLYRNFDEAERLFDIIIAHASGNIDKANAYNTMIVLYTNTRGPKEAIALGISALRLFGIKLDMRTGSAKVLWELLKVRLRLRKFSLEAIRTLPHMADEERKAYHNIMFNIGTPAYFVNPNLFAYLVLKGVRETLKYGLAPHATVAFISLASILENVLGEYNLGYEMGKMAMKLDERLENRKLSGMAHHIFAYFIQHWNRHAKHDVPVFRKAYQLCLDHGNFIYAGHGINASTDTRLMIGERLDDILHDIEKYKGFIYQIKDPFIAGLYAEHIQVLRCLTGLNPDPVKLSGQDFDEAAQRAKLIAENHLYGLCFILVPKMRLLYLFGRYQEARETAEEVDRIIKVPMGTLTVAEHYFYYSLILAALLKMPETSNKGKIRRIINRNQRKMDKWAAVCPENFRHKHDLVQAEMTACGRWYLKAPALYHAAIKGAQTHGYINEEALACERLALFYHRYDAREEARFFFQRAYQAYGYWGATAKQDDLEKRYPYLAGPKKGSNEALRNGSKTETTSSFLDLTTMMQVSQAISSEIMLDRLLLKIMQLSLANAGAQRGFLLLNKEGRLTLAAGEDLEREGRRLEMPLPLEESRELSHAIVQYVARRLEPIILADASGQGPFSTDPHVAGNQCKSILCMPILSKGTLLAVLYMENNLTANAFTSERLEILGIIAAQAAISIENAQLFELATTDGLTKLLVHRYFQLLLKNEIERSRRYNRPLSLVMLDIDNFKRFNDTYGHPMGDEVLKSVARILRENIRSVDIAARYGGEEFVLILPETDSRQALVVSEKVRHQVEAMRIPTVSRNLQVTISLGIATFPQHALEKKELIAAADQALYASKHMGKNCVSVAGELGFIQNEPMAGRLPCVPDNSRDGQEPSKAVDEENIRKRKTAQPGV